MRSSIVQEVASWLGSQPSAQTPATVTPAPTQPPILNQTQSRQEEAEESESVSNQRAYSPEDSHSYTVSLAGSSTSFKEREDDPKTKRRKEKREAWVEKIYDILPQLPKPEEPEPLDEAAWLFGQKERPPSKMGKRLPISAGLTKQLERKAKQHFDWLKKSKSSVSKPWPAAKKIAEHYRTRDPEETLLSTVHAVSSKLVDEVPSEKTKSRCVSVKARLDPKQEPGKIEAACLEKAELATTGLRITNNLTLDLNAIVEILNKLKVANANFRARPALDVKSLEGDNLLQALISRETEVSDLCSLLAGQLNLATEGLEDAQLCASDSFNLHAAEYISAIGERRQVWLKASSNIPEEVQQEINLTSLVLPTLGEEGPLDLLGPDGTKRLDLLKESRHTQTEKAIESLSVVGAASLQNVSKKPFQIPKLPPRKRKRSKVEHKTPLSESHSSQNNQTNQNNFTQNSFRGSRGGGNQRGGFGQPRNTSSRGRGQSGNGAGRGQFKHSH